MEFIRYIRPDLSLVERVLTALEISAEDKAACMASSVDPLISKAACLVAAKERIEIAKINHEKVFVAGDYDADGIMATTIMKSCLDLLGIQNGYYIPDRFKDGYGLNPNIVKMAYDKGYRLIITVDNGVKAETAIALAQSLGMDVIVTDHHQWDGDIEASVVVHPSLLESEFEYLSGAGIALLLARQFMEDDRHLIFAMIATIGDQMMMLRANRQIVKAGLAKLNQSKLASVCQLLNDKACYDEDDMAFQIVPKINALGRLEDNSNANVLVSYFLLDDIREIAHLKTQINQCNELRKTLSNEMVAKCLSLSQQEGLILVEDEHFHEGICGLAAGALSKKKNRPAIVLSHKEGLLKGSGRGVKGTNLYQYLDKHRDLFETFGGHEMAVGLSIKKDNFEVLKARLAMDPLTITPYKEKVIEVYLDELNLSNISQLMSLRPFGNGFRLPYFYLSKQPVLHTMLIKGKYPKWILSKSPNLEAISFDADATWMKKPNYWVFEPQINTFNGSQNVSMLVKIVG